MTNLVHGSLDTTHLTNIFPTLDRRFNLQIYNFGVKTVQLVVEAKSAFS